MSKQYPGGLITKNPVTPSGAGATSSASGVWTLAEQAYWQKQGLWPNPANVAGQQAYTTAGTYTWVAPTGVTSVAVVAVGGGGASGGFSGNGGGGGALAYKNCITVVPGNSYTVVVGQGSANNQNCGNCATASSFGGLFTAGAGASGSGYAGGAPSGAYTGGGSGGTGGNVGGGGAGGYSGNGGNGGACGSPSGAGAGGAASGGGANAGGGVGILGQGSSGTSVTNSPGIGGSGGGNGTTRPCGFGTVSGGSYGGGGYWNGRGAGGAVRIIWPANGWMTRAFPSTNTGNL